MISQADNLEKLRKEAIEEVVSSVKKLFLGRYAVAISGSLGKKKSDNLSDIDIRTFYDQMISEPDLSRVKKEIDQIIGKWKQSDIVVDGYWPRPISEIDELLHQVVTGENIDPEPCLWTIWGYYLPTDIFTMRIIDDPFGILEKWKLKLDPYPSIYKQKTIEKYLRKIMYWRNDYHYKNKAIRQDVLFCHGLSNLLVHSIIQILYALNNTYYTGDGWNLETLSSFSMLPARIEHRLSKIIFLNGSDSFTEQRRDVCSLIDDVISILEKHKFSFEDL